MSEREMRALDAWVKEHPVYDFFDHAMQDTWLAACAWMRSCAAPAADNNESMGRTAAVHSEAKHAGHPGRRYKPAEPRLREAVPPTYSLPVPAPSQPPACAAAEELERDWNATPSSMLRNAVFISAIAALKASEARVAHEQKELLAACTRHVRAERAINARDQTIQRLRVLAEHDDLLDADTTDDKSYREGWNQAVDYIKAHIREALTDTTPTDKDTAP